MKPLLAFFCKLVIFAVFLQSTSHAWVTRRRRQTTTRSPTTTTRSPTTTTPQPSTAPTTTPCDETELELWQRYIGKMDIPDLTVKTCEGKIYDDYAQYCCGGKILTKKPYKGCCGGKVFDTYSNECKSDTVVARQFKCNDQPYDEKKNFCFNDQLYKIQNHVISQGAVYRYVDSS